MINAEIPCFIRMVRLVLFSTAIYMAVFKRHSFWAKNITIMSYNYPLNSEKCPTSFHFMYDFFFLIQTMLDKISHKFLPRKMSEICCACKKSRTLYGSDIICNFPYHVLCPILGPSTFRKFLGPNVSSVMTEAKKLILYEVSEVKCWRLSEVGG